MLTRPDRLALISACHVAVFLVVVNENLHASPSDIHFQYNGFLFGFLLLSVAKHLQVPLIYRLTNKTCFLIFFLIQRKISCQLF